MAKCCEKSVHGSGGRGVVCGACAGAEAKEATSRGPGKSSGQGACSHSPEHPEHPPPPPPHPKTFPPGQSQPEKQGAGLGLPGRLWEEGRASVPSGPCPSWAMASAPGAIPAPGSSLSFLMQSLVSVHPRTDWAPGLGTDPQQQHVAWGPGEHEESAVNTGHCVLPPGGRRFIKTAVICRVSVR